MDGEALYDIIADPGQQTNVAAEHPDVVRRLREDYEKWWASLESATNQTVRYVLGGAENPMTLSSHDWLMRGVEQAAWHQNQIRSGALINGAWAVDVKQAGNYAITLYRWPPYLNQAMNVTEARLFVGGVDERTPVYSNAVNATFRVKLKPGPTMLQTWLTRPDGKQHGAYYTSIRFDNGGTKPGTKPRVESAPK